MRIIKDDAYKILGSRIPRDLKGVQMNTRQAVALVLIMIAATFMIPTQVYTKRLESLKVSVKLTHEPQEASKVIIIQGQVLEDSKGVSDALVSIQVNDPRGESIHIALTYSNKTGHFYDEFLLKGVTPGNYTLYLTASKIGYRDVVINIPFTLYSDFNLMISPKFLELKPGEYGNCTIEAVPDYPEEISLRIVSYPKFLKYTLTPTYIPSGGYAILYVNASKSAVPGKYNITVAGIADGRIRQINLTLLIPKVEEPSNVTTTQKEGRETLEAPFYYVIPQRSKYVILGVASVAIITSFLVARFRRRKRGVDLSYMSAARAIAKIEELKAMGKIDDETYERLKREYESKL